MIKTSYSDGYKPDWNTRFPRSVREEGTLYVFDEVKTAPDGKSYSVFQVNEVHG